MKRIALLLICASFTSAMVATSFQPETEVGIKSRGQPSYQPFTYETYVVSELPEMNLSEELFVSEIFSPFIATNSEAVLVPGITVGNRKVRDVDLCSSSNSYNKNIDIRTAIKNKNTRLPRGSIRCKK